MELPSRNLRRGDAAHGLTLVELLVTIMILGILSSSVLFAMSMAQEAARKSRTQAVIATLHSLLIEKWESYLTRRHNIFINDEYSQSGPRAAAAFRLKAIRQMLKMDFPDQWLDVEYLTLNSDAISPNMYSYVAASFSAARSSGVNYINSLPGLSDTEKEALLFQNEGAECLYLIIEFARPSADRYKLLDSSYIGDTDGDSLLEILDGWGRPISFIRWPAGFISDMQAGKPGAISSLSGADADSGWLDHDPFDPYRVEAHAYRLVPLIVSAGPDGLFDVATAKLNYKGPSALDMNNRWNPYYVKDGRRPGETYDQNDNTTEDWHDNIHNHLINTR